MTEFTPVAGLVGGALIGLAAVVLMIGLGRVAGISGILGALIAEPGSSDASWRAVFLVGLIAGAAIAGLAGWRDLATLGYSPSLVLMAVAGAVVGVGATVGSGCTSGHGVCGLSRLSARSLAATAIFMASAIITVFITRHLV